MSASLDKDYKKDNDLNRWDIFKKIGDEPQFPNIDGMEYLLHHCKQIGFTSSNGMGLSPVSYQEIEAYCGLTGLEFTPEEVNVIIEMSRNYVKYVTDKNPNAIAPFKKG